ncbi:uncharacterized protein METZ01_LOCUS373606 [marine metagenome]|uniref:Uncharacterized protein n=1 Tax=marine metagenome TaxID=408172 RepID=A0A382TG47_9ZZZZ
MTSEEYEEDQRALLLEARNAIRRVEYLLERLSYLLRDWPMVKRVIDQEIEKNKELTTYIKGTVERRYKKSA